ncbi:MULTISPECIES: amidohydrolase [unclassified Sulfuricurvum]|uniref:amidohydrolase n=1 Tax=unclassified Sulfuricurvum TaxID=2632390 RepID=UPI000AB8A70B|nr:MULTISPECIES: amidohydrolase [unclassified Sulfuricurvum]
MLHIVYCLIGIFFMPMNLQSNTIFINGAIYTVNQKNPWAHAIVIDHDMIRYVGTTKEAFRYKKRNSEIVDLNGSFVMPGIIDAHTHIAMASVLLNEGVNLLEVKGKSAILNEIKRYADSHSDASVITGFGFYPYTFGPNGPSASQLDSVISNRPVFLISNNGHSAWVNSKALSILKINKETPDPQPGIHYYVRDDEGNPTGFLVEGCAFWPHLAKMGIGSKASFYGSLKEYLPKLSAQGITALFDAGAPAVETYSFEALRQLEKESALPLRYFGSHFILSAQDAKDAAKTFIRYQKKYNTSLFTLSSVKFSNDNSDDDHFAMQFDDRELKPYFLTLMRHNLDVMVHTSADESVHSALDAIEYAKNHAKHTHSRFTLAHVNMVRDSDFKRFKDLGVIANIQPFNAQGDGYYNYRYMLYGDKWENKLARYNTFFKHGAIVSSSSDFPACNNDLDQCSPLHGMQMGITRQKVSSFIDTSILPDPNERLNIEQMIRAYTINAAFQLHREKEIGSLEIGKKADLVVLDRNPFKTNAKELHKIQVVKTMMNGKIVYEKSI